MKKIISVLAYLASLIGLLYYVFFIPEPTNKQIMYAIIFAINICISSIQKDQE